MSVRVCAVGLLLAVLATTTASSAGRLEPGPASVPAQRASTLLPVQFEQNVGQVDGRVKFLARWRESTLYLTSTAFVLSMRKSGGKAAAVQIAFAGASDATAVTGLGDVVSRSNYFTGRDNASWRRSIAQYGRVRYQGIYDNIDMIVYARDQQLEYDLLVGPHANPASIRLDIAGGTASIDDNGNLLINTSVGAVAVSRPRAYQETAGGRREIAARYRVLDSNRIGFNVEDYDSNKPLVIDPVLEYATYLGGAGWDWPNDLKVDAAGNAYICGFTEALGFPTTLGPAMSGGGWDAFIAKIRPDGSLEYSTFMGGGGLDTAQGLLLDASGAVTVTGETKSADFPIIDALQTSRGGGTDSDAFIAKLDANGSSLLYSSYLGGSGIDAGVRLATDATGALYVAGVTNSPDFPVVTPLQPQFAGGFLDVFVAKIDVQGRSLLYSTYLGGSNSDGLSGMAVDAAGEVYVSGYTFSTDFPVVAPLQAHLSGSEDGFISKLRADGAALVYSTYIGGTGIDSVNDVKVDGDGSVLLTGATQGGIPTTAGVYQPFYGQGFNDAFVSRLSPDGQRFLFSTYFGGKDLDGGVRLAIDSAGRIWIAGGTSSTNLPVVRPIQAAYADGGQDAFVAQFSSNGSQLLFSTYLGGTNLESAEGLALDGRGNVYVVAETASTDLPTVRPLQSVNAGAREVFVAKIAMNRMPTADAGADQTLAADAQCTATVQLNGSGSSDPDGDALTYTWTGSFGSAKGPSPVVTLGTGTHAITLEVNDGAGGTSSDVMQVNVVDVIPPSIAGLTATPATLEPPNHQMVSISLAADVAPSCDATATCRIVAISSNEPEDGLGDGDTGPDWIITGPLTAQLRSERAGSGSGRVYTVRVMCTDAAGNSSTRDVTVTVH